MVDHFQIVEMLGEGGYAEVYRAVDTQTGKTVVLKSADPNRFGDPALFQRYRREADIARRVNHPGVQRSLDAADHRSEPYLILEFVEGENLRGVLRRRAPLPIDEAIDWATQLATTLEYLHGQGIIHRDLKPENVLVSSDGQLKIVDFGSAMREASRRMTWRRLTEVVGTPEYMSPEQAQGRRGDARSDIYSLGTIVYELLTGRPPFQADNWQATLARHLDGTPTRIREIRPEVSPALEAVVLTALRRYPEHRYQDEASLLDDLKRLDELDNRSFDLSLEPPMGSIAAIDSTRKLWILVGIVAASFIGLVTAIVGLSVLLR
jgi:serine/threonine-protein kinase